MKRRDGNGSVNGGRAAVDSTLATIDAALESDRVTAVEPEDRQVQELALALRADSARPRPEFARELDRRLELGFPRDRRSPLGRLAPVRGRAGRPVTRRPASASKRSRPRRALPGLAATASILLALGIVIPLSTGGRGVDTTPAPETMVSPAEPETSEPVAPGESSGGGATGARGLAAPTGDLVAPPPGSRAGAEPGAGRENRRVERSASMTLIAPPDELQEVGEGIATIADQRDGFLRSSSLTSGEGPGGGGSFEMRLPVGELEAALAELSQLAQVESLTQAGEDLTARIVREGNEVDELRSELRDLRAELEATEDSDEREELRGEIRRVQSRLERTEAQVGALRDRTSFATVTITLEAGEIESDGLGAAFDDALELLAGVAGVVVRSLGVLLPLAIAAGMVWAIARARRRRRRESALA